MVYKRYLKKSETDDDAVPPEVTEEDARLNSIEEAEDQDSDSDSVRGKNPRSSRDILAQKLHDHIISQFPNHTADEHAAIIRTILSTQVEDPVTGQMKFKYIDKNMRNLFKEHPRDPTPGVPQNRVAILSGNPVTYTPLEMLNPTTSIALMRVPKKDEYASIRSPEREVAKPETKNAQDDEYPDVWLSLGKNTQILDIMVKSLLRKIANGEI